MSQLLDRPADTTLSDPEGGPSQRNVSFSALVAVFACIAIAATMTSSPGVWIADARLEFSTNPVSFLAGHQFSWDETRGMGNTVTWYSPVLGSFQSLVSLVVSDIWIIQRLVHALLLTTAAASMAFLLRVVRPRASWLHLVGGLAYAFNPYTSQFLLPSGLFLSYALSPLLLGAFLRGVSQRDEAWRMAALFALGVFSVGALNTAALVYAGLPMIVALVYLVLVERSTSWSAVGGWIARAALLTLGVSTAAVVILWFQRGDIALNLATTERPDVVSSRSSWAESWRGLGMWLTYYRDAYGPLRPQAAPYFESWPVMLASYAAPAAATVTLVVSRWRPRIFFGALFSIGVFLMVGLWPVESPSPFGRLLEWLFENTPLFGLRTTYKAGALYSIGVSALAAVAIVWGFRAAPGDDFTRTTRSPASRVPSAVLAGALIVAALPFWTGGLYNSDDGFTELPDYWSEALDWLNEQPEDGRVLVLPGVVRARYRWGYVNDNLFHGLLDKSLVAHQSIPPPGTPVASDIVRALDEYIASDAFVPGAIGPMLRRLGVRWVLFQNDLEWARLGVGRPASFDQVRADPALRPAESFGEPGQNTTSPDDPTALSLGENELPPVQVYEVVDGNDTIRVSTDRPLVVSGGGDSWPQLSSAGLLSSGPIAYSSLMPETELADALGTGSAVVVTDGARRRAIQVRTGRMELSHTLSATEDFFRAPVSPFPPEGQSVTTFPDAVTIEATRVGTGALPFDPSIRPSMAFDERTDTAWTVAGPGADGATIEVALDESAAIEQVDVRQLDGADDRYAAVLRLEVDSASGATSSYVRNVDADGLGSPHSFSVDVPDAVAFRISVEGLVGEEALPVGLTDVVVTTADGPLDLREFVQSPIDLQLAAERSPDVADALDSADVSFSFSRSIGSRMADEEVDVRRLFWSPRDLGSELTGTIRLGAETPSTTVDHLLGGEVGATSETGAADGVTLGGWAADAVDGDLKTAWLGTPTTDAQLLVRPPEGTLRTVSIVTEISTGDRESDQAFSEIQELDLVVETRGEVERIAATPGPLACVSTDAGGGCSRTFTATLPAGTYEEIEIEVTEVANFATRPIAIAEVLFDGELASNQDWGSSCVDAAVLNDRVIAVRLLDPVEDLLAGEPVRFASCGSVEVAAGRNSFESLPELSGALSDVLVANPASARVPPESSGATAVTVVERTPTRIVLSMRGPGPYTLIGPGSFHAGWRAFIDGEPLGQATPLDAQSSWNLGRTHPTDGSEFIITLEFRPQRTYELALAISLGTAALALALVLGGRRRRVT